ncbi:hypothetical protein FACS1894206_06380 [Deltaproteobacteria bacterium]|nr:hypothetical protein FACS1894206_06380 [Deltaproteobacteria bacterium]
MNALLFAAAGVLLGSALFLSHDLFAFLGLNGGMKAHTLHLSAAYWVLVLSGIHMGLHWEKIAGRLRGRKGARPASFLIALYGMYAFWKREVGYKLIGSYSFDFWDYDKPAVFFFLDCLAIMGACIWMTRYARGLSKRMRGA